LPGVRFRPLWFRPTFDKWQDQLCGGVQLHVLDRCAFRPFRTGLQLLKAALRLAPEAFAWRQPPFEYDWEHLPIDILAGTDAVRNQLEQGADPAEIEAQSSADLAAFVELRNAYLRY
jgi:uncharacterized protein YbbC (DUF1343 family)